MRGGKPLHFLVGCLHCHKVCNKHKFTDMSHHIETEHDKSTPIAGTDFLIYTVCFETPDDTQEHSSNTATSKVTSTKRHSNIGEISRTRARERREREKERSPSSSSASESSNDEVELVTTTMLEPQESDDSPDETETELPFLPGKGERVLLIETPFEKRRFN